MGQSSKQFAKSMAMAMSPCCVDLSPPPSITTNVSEVLTHFKHVFTNRLHIAQVAKRRFAQALIEALPGQAVF
jgi:hypothetical protein